MKASPGWVLAGVVHRRSVVVLKNSGDILPLAPGSKVYVEVFHKVSENAAAKTEQARAEATGFELVDDPDRADVLMLILEPSPAATSTRPRASWS